MHIWSTKTHTSTLDSAWNILNKNNDRFWNMQNRLLHSWNNIYKLCSSQCKLFCHSFIRTIFTQNQSISKHKILRKKVKIIWVDVTITFVPLCSSSLAKGRTPRTISIPLLSTKMAAHLWGGPLRRSSHSSKPSTNHGRAVGKMYYFYVNFKQNILAEHFSHKRNKYLASLICDIRV